MEIGITMKRAAIILIFIQFGEIISRPIWGFVTNWLDSSTCQVIYELVYLNTFLKNSSFLFFLWLRALKEIIIRILMNNLPLQRLCNSSEIEFFFKVWRHCEHFLHFHFLKEKNIFVRFKFWTFFQLIDLIRLFCDDLIWINGLPPSHLKLIAVTA